jgi:hypothetical protein
LPKFEKLLMGLEMHWRTKLGHVPTRPPLALTPIPGILEVRQAAGGVCLHTPRWLTRSSGPAQALQVLAGGPSGLPPQGGTNHKMFGA